MKKAFLLLAILLVFSCHSDTELLYGNWRVDSTFYKANYEILEVDNLVKAKIIYYNDDTTVIRDMANNPRYILTNILQKNKAFVDAVSGATTSNKYATKMTIKHKDTLEVITHIMNKPLKELWIRIKQ